MNLIQTNQTTNLINTQLDPKSRTWVEISKPAILHNINQFRQIIGPNIQLAVVAKSNAYGHGLEQITQIAQESENANWLCIFSLYEGIIARNSGFKKNILVLGHVDLDPELAILNSIDLTVFDFEFLQKLNNLAQKLNLPAYVHVKVDTGLSRLGLFPHDALELIKKAQNLPFIKIRGIFSHFAESDAKDQNFTHRQVNKFTWLLNELKKAKIQIPFIHCSNTTGIVRFGSCHFTLTRTGGGTYGLYKSTEINELGQKKHLINLKLALTWKAKIMQIKELPAGSYVSYARTFVTYRKTKIALIPIGYWDGYNRQLSNKGCVYIKGIAAPIVGRVCMNVIIVDITDIQNVTLSDEAILLGNLPGINPDDIAQLTGSINYEATTRINPTISRIII